MSSGVFLAFAAGVLVGAGWAESQVVRERIRQAWRRGYESGAAAVANGFAVRIPAKTNDAIAVEALIRETRG